MFIASLSIAAVFFIRIAVVETPDKRDLITHCHSAPNKLIHIKGGTFTMGAGALYPEEGPPRQVSVNDFYISQFEVTNEEFASFVKDTGYITVAERALSPEDYPDIPANKLVPGSAVFVGLHEAVEAKTFLDWWHFVEGASWRHPFGPESTIVGKEHYPVVHIALEDAVAYATWKGHRLPTEAEYEYAAKATLTNATYARGDSLMVDGQHVANTWQGFFPFSDNGEDGFIGASPVGCFAPNVYGLHDLIGNVWEWTYPNDKKEETTHTKARNTAIIKGGSYLCSPDFCMRYRPAARQAQDTGMGTNHIGFRTVKDI